MGWCSEEATCHAHPSLSKLIQRSGLAAWSRYVLQVSPKAAAARCGEGTSWERRPVIFAGLSQADLEAFNASSYSFFNLHPPLPAATAAAGGLGLEDELEAHQLHRRSGGAEP